MDGLPTREEEVKHAIAALLPRKRTKRSSSAGDAVPRAGIARGRWSDGLVALADRVAEQLSARQLPKAMPPRSETAELLELADFMMREQVTAANGLWLKGSLTCYQERALQLLQLYEGDMSLTKFHILFPRVMASPAYRRELLQSISSTEELDKLIAEAIIDLRGCKTQEAEEAIEIVRRALLNRLTVEELN